MISTEQWKLTLLNNIHYTIHYNYPYISKFITNKHMLKNKKIFLSQSKFNLILLTKTDIKNVHSCSNIVCSSYKIQESS